MVLSVGVAEQGTFHGILIQNCPLEQNQFLPPCTRKG
jgi:hypothetical protein